MKKILTLFAFTLVELIASAQETVLFDYGASYGNGATLKSDNTKLVLGNDRTTQNYNLKLSTAKAYCAELFGQTVMVENSETGEMEEKTRVVYVVGNQNPKDGELDGDKSQGSEYKPINHNLPQSSTYYMITPNKNGHITAFIILSGGKSLYVVKASNGESLSVSELTIKADGEKATKVTINDDFTVDEKITGTLEFDVNGGETYYVFCTGSKLSLGGYMFEAGDLKCATPTIHYSNGKLYFECETDGVSYHPTIIKPNVSYSDNEVQLGTTYQVSVYATKYNYIKSEIATAEINIIEEITDFKGDMNNDGELSIADIWVIVDKILK